MCLQEARTQRAPRLAAVDRTRRTWAGACALGREGFAVGRRVRVNLALASPRLKICWAQSASGAGVRMNFCEPRTARRAARLRPQAAILGTYGQFAPDYGALRSACRNAQESQLKRCFFLQLEVNCAYGLTRCQICV